MTIRRSLRPREALLVVPILGIVGVVAAEVSAHSVAVTVVSLAASGIAIGLYLVIEWTWPNNSGVSG